MKYFIDANILLDFMEIRRLDLLVRLFDKMDVVFRIDEEIVFYRGYYEKYRSNFPVCFSEEEWEEKLAEMNNKYGFGVGTNDRSAAIAAKFSDAHLLTRDMDLIDEAKDLLSMTDSDFISTVEILCMLVNKKFLSKIKALDYCQEISDKRCPIKALDCTPIKSLPD